ncbi:MAG TPA: response regulator, partial [Pirellulales bacterium]|nr:response regulator [Pirellulales bacterium]
WVESALGRGSTFHFTASFGLDRQATGAPNAIAPSPLSTVVSAPRRILLVEDSPVNQKVALGILRRRGHDVVVANNGTEALARFGEQRFDVVLMDMQMPEMDGLQAAGEIRRRESPSGEHVPIIAMTANVMKGDRERCLAAGMNDYLSKPITAEALLSMVECDQQPTRPTWTDRQADQCKPVPGAVEPVATADSEVFDCCAALERYGNDHEMLRGLITTFLELCPRMMVELSQAIDEHDVQRLIRAAHTLRGSADALAGHAVARAALHVERLANEGGTDDFGSEVSELHDEVDRFCRAISQVLGVATSNQLEISARPPKPCRIS